MRVHEDLEAVRKVIEWQELEAVVPSEERQEELEAVMWQRCGRRTAVLEVQLEVDSFERDLLTVMSYSQL